MDTFWQSYTNPQIEWERLPFTRPLKQKTGDDIGAMFARVQAVQV
jgi:hypothetical protein